QGLKRAAEKGFKLDREVLIVSNSMDFNVFSKKELVQDEFVVVGWQGSNTHSEDCRDAFSVVVDVLDNNPNVRMDICGAQSFEVVDKWETVIENEKLIRRKTKIQQQSKLGLHPNSRFRRWVPVGEYAN